MNEEKPTGWRFVRLVLLTVLLRSCWMLVWACGSAFAFVLAASGFPGHPLTELLCSYTIAGVLIPASYFATSWVAPRLTFIPGPNTDQRNLEFIRYTVAATAFLPVSTLVLILAFMLLRIAV